MIELTALHRRFGAVVAVADVSLSIAPGEVLGFLGPNGAGKTTTMKMLTGYLEPTSGSATVFGHSVSDDPLPIQRRLGYLPEGAPLWPDMTPRSLLDFCGRVRGLAPALLRRRIASISTQLDLQEVMTRRVGELSKGFRRRVGLATALLHDPDLLVLDEPTDGLDPNQKHQVRALIQTLSQDKIVVVSTHILEEVDAVCTRAAIINQGRIVVDETPATLRRRSRWHGALSIRFSTAALDQAALLQLPGVVAAEARDNTGQAWTLFTRDGEDGQETLAALQSTCTSSGLELRELHMHTGRLDDVFGAVTDRSRDP